MKEESDSHVARVDKTTILNENITNENFLVKKISGLLVILIL